MIRAVTQGATRSPAENARFPKRRTVIATVGLTGGTEIATREPSSRRASTMGELAGSRPSHTPLPPVGRGAAPVAFHTVWLLCATPATDGRRGGLPLIHAATINTLYPEMSRSSTARKRDLLGYAGWLWNDEQRKVQPSDRLRKEIKTFFEDMGSADNGAERAGASGVHAYGAGRPGRSYCQKLWIWRDRATKAIDDDLVETKQ